MFLSFSCSESQRYFHMTVKVTCIRPMAPVQNGGPLDDL